MSYYERAVANQIAQIAREHGLHVEADPWGNVLASSSGAPPMDARLAFVAHMDHPGFEVVERLGDDTLRAVSHGGMCPTAFLPGAPVEVIAPDGERISGMVTKAEDVQERGPFATSEAVQIEVEASVSELPAMAVLALPDFVLDGGVIRARALDDLAGCASILTAMILAKDSAEPCIGVFTRAEEVGLVGARLIAESGMLDPECVVVSVETSLKSASAVQGDGVVIRTGDRMTTFDNGAERILRASAGTSQRALMSAGGCEASAFAAFGYRVTGTSLPLGAWHNREEDGSLAMEYVALTDYVSGIELLANAMTMGADIESKLAPNPLRQHPSDEAERLRVDVADWV